MEIMIRASKGMWLTDGENYGKTISLGKGVSLDAYHEITDAEYKKRTEEQENETM